MKKCCDKKKKCDITLPITGSDVQYREKNLDFLNIKYGDDYHEVLYKINEIISHITGGAGTYYFNNVGEGLEIYRETTPEGVVNFKTLQAGEGVAIDDLGDLIKISNISPGNYFIFDSYDQAQDWLNNSESKPHQLVYIEDTNPYLFIVNSQADGFEPFMAGIKTVEGISPDSNGDIKLTDKPHTWEEVQTFEKPITLGNLINVTPNNSYSRVVVTSTDGSTNYIDRDSLATNSLYTWAKYSNYSNGRNELNQVEMSDNPVIEGNYATFEGVSYNNENEVGSNIPEDYTWRRIRGEDGSPVYTWIKYSNYQNGRNEQGAPSMYDDIIIGGDFAEYEGLSYNNPTEVESNIPEDYVWRRIKGEDGQSVYKVDLSNESIVIPTDAEGNLYPTSLEDAKTNIKVFKGGQLLPTQEYDIELIPTNVTISNTVDLSGTITGFSVTNIFDDNGSVLVNATLQETGEYIGSDTFNISKSKGVASYELKVSSDYLHINSQGVYTTGVITAEVYKNTGIVNEPTNEGRIVYWTRKSNNSTPQVTFPASGLDTSTLPNDIDALYVAFIYPESTIIGDQEELVVVRDGTNGVGRSFIALDNQNIVLSAAYNGAVSNYNFATTAYQVYVNGVEYNESNLSVETSSSTLGLVYTHNESNKTISITNIPNLVNEAKIDLVAKINGEVIATAEIKITKIRGGQDGENGIVYALRPERSVIKVDRLGNISPTTLKIDVVKIDGNNVTTNPGDGVVIQYKVGTSSPTTDLAQGGSIPQSYIAAAVSGARSYIQVQLIDSNSNVLDIEDIDISRDGTQGEQGLTGRIPRVMQWIPGQVYYNNGEFIDYIYFYSSNESHAGFYNVKRENGSTVAPATPVGSSRFVKTEYTATQVFGTFIAEGSHVGGFTTANNMFYSTEKTIVHNSCTNQNQEFFNLIMYGLLGRFDFGNRLQLSMNGITFRDNCGRVRIEFGWEEETGTPYLRFLDEDGEIKWEAGKEYTEWITQGTQPPSWSPAIRLGRIASLGTNPSLDFSDPLGVNANNVKSYINPFLTNTPMSHISATLQSHHDAYFTTTVYTATTGNRLSAFQLAKGDMAANVNLHEALYKNKTPVTTSQLPSSNIIDDGWYIQEMFSGQPGGMLMAQDQSMTPRNFYVQIVCYQNGIQVNTANVVVHTKTE